MALEQFIIRHRVARYVFVLATWPFVAIKDRIGRVFHPVGLRKLRIALCWAQRGGEPGSPPERPEPSPISPRWSRP